MPERRVAITGLGVVSPAGAGMDALWEALQAGQSFTRKIAAFDASAFPTDLGGCVENFSARDYVPKNYRKSVKIMARDIELAVGAAGLAFADAGIVTAAAGEGAATTIEPGRLGCNIGAGLICTDLDEIGVALTTALDDEGKFSMAKWGAGGMNNLTPLWLLKYLPNMLACHVTIVHGAKGPSNTITCGDASAHLAIGEATRLVARGGADAVIAGGAESKLNPMGLLRQSLLKRLCTTWRDDASGACRPFDTQHAGTVIGEGGGLLVVEEMEHARARGARMYAEVVGFASSCDPNGIEVEKPSAGGLGQAVRAAMKDAGITSRQVGLIVTHGTAVPGEDVCETAEWQSVLGDLAGRIPAVAITGSLGSLFAGAGGVELAAAARALHSRTVPPTVNFSAAAPDCGLALASTARPGDFEYAVSAAFSVGGQSGACVLRRIEP